MTPDAHKIAVEAVELEKCGYDPDPATVATLARAYLESEKEIDRLRTNAAMDSVRLKYYRETLTVDSSYIALRGPHGEMVNDLAIDPRRLGDVLDENRTLRLQLSGKTMHDAAAVEREECAKIADGYGKRKLCRYCDAENIGSDIADDIRARGKALAGEERK